MCKRLRVCSRRSCDGADAKRRRLHQHAGAVDVPEEPGNKNDEQVAVRQADARENKKRHPSEQKRIRGSK